MAAPPSFAPPPFKAPPPPGFPLPPPPSFGKMPVPQHQPQSQQPSPSPAMARAPSAAPITTAPAPAAAIGNFGYGPKTMPGAPAAPSFAAPKGPGPSPAPFATPPAAVAAAPQFASKAPPAIGIPAKNLSPPVALGTAAAGQGGAGAAAPQPPQPQPQPQPFAAPTSAAAPFPSPAPAAAAVAPAQPNAFTKQGPAPFPAPAFSQPFANKFPAPGPTAATAATVAGAAYGKASAPSPSPAPNRPPLQLPVSVGKGFFPPPPPSVGAPPAGFMGGKQMPAPPLFGGAGVVGGAPQPLAGTLSAVAAAAAAGAVGTKSPVAALPVPGTPMSLPSSSFSSPLVHQPTGPAPFPQSMVAGSPAGLPPPPPGGNRSAFPPSPLQHAPGGGGAPGYNNFAQPQPVQHAPPTAAAMQQHNAALTQQQQQQTMNRQQSDASIGSANQKPAEQQQQQQYQSQSQMSYLPHNGRARMRAKPQGQNRIDSLQMPSPCRDLVVDGHPAYKWPATPFACDNRASSVPPTTASGTPCIDEGNAVSKFLRPTVHHMPWDEACMTKANILWGAALSPLCSKSVSAATGGGSRGLPVIHEAAIGTPNSEPVRCSRCRAYMTSWNPFNGTGHAWICGFCSMSNDVPESYFAPIASGGKRRDHLERPELSRGSYEVDVSHIEKYWAEGPKDLNGGGSARPPIRPKPMHHLFVIEVSKQAAPTLRSVANAIRDAVDAMPDSGFSACTVSFVTYASTLHFYDFSDERMPQLVVPDTTNPFVPLPFNMLCWLSVETQRDLIHRFLDRLEDPDFVAAVDETGCAIGAACKAAQLILADIGGKVIITGTGAPTEGVGKIPERDVGRMYGNVQTEAQLFRPQPGFWPDLALDCARRHISFDLYLFPSGTNMDLVTLGQISHLTNGKQWLFTNFTAETDGERLRRRVYHALNDEAGFGAILRTRCSAGVRVKAYHGHFTQTDPQDMDLACVDSSSTFFVEFKHEGVLDKKSAGLIQVALLYTTRNGRRRVRVHTMRLNVAENYSNLFRYTDLEATAQAFISLGIHEAFNKGVKAAREWIVSQTVSLLVGYRVHSQAGSHSGQLLLPENLKLMPLYNLCLMKSDALASGTVVRFDDRVQNMYELLSYPQDRLLFYLYPRCFAMHALPDPCGDYKINDNNSNDLPSPSSSGAAAGGAGGGGQPEEEEEETDARPKVFLPGMLQLTADNIHQGGVYLLQDLQARIVFLMIGSQVPADRILSMFGVENGNTAAVCYEQMDQWHPKMRRITQQIIDETGGRLVIVREKADMAALEDAFFRNLLEDEGPNKETCYSEFLCVLHKQINNKAKSG